MSRKAGRPQPDHDFTFEEFLKTSVSSEDDTEKRLQSQPKGNKDTAGPLWWDINSETTNADKGLSYLKTQNTSKSVMKSTSPSKGSIRNPSEARNVLIKPKPQKQHDGLKRQGEGKQQKSKQQNSPGQTKTLRARTDTSVSKDSLENISERSEEHDPRDTDYLKQKTVIAFKDSSIEASDSFEDKQQIRKTTEHLGSDTFDELEEKEQFFQKLENDHKGAVDYGRLNQDLSHTGATGADNSVLSFPAGGDITPVRITSLDVMESSLQKPSMLSRVALLDSIESTLNTTPSPKMTNSRETAQELFVSLPGSNIAATASALIGTNTSKDMEDLQKILQEAEETPTIYEADSHPSDRITNDRTAAEVQKEASRSIGDILREIEVIDRRASEIESHEVNVQLRSNYTTPQTAGNSPRYGRDKISEKQYVHQRRPDSRAGDSTNLRTTSGDRRTETALAGRGRADSREKLSSAGVDKSNFNSRGRFSHVPSSGYGRSTSPQTKATVQFQMPEKSPPKASTSKSSQDIHKKDSSKAHHSTNRPEVIEPTAQYKKPTHKIQSPNQSDTSKYELEGNVDVVRQAGILDQMKDLLEQLNMEKAAKTELQEKLSNQEMELNRQLKSQKLKYEEEILALKQENFVLSAKLKEFEGQKIDKILRSNSGGEKGTKENSEDNEVVSLLKKEVKEQENLLAGYQAENKRLYEEIKGVQKQVKIAEASMFKENQRLTAELTNVRQELELKSTELQNKGIITGLAAQQQIAAGNSEALMGVRRTAFLEGELAEAKRVQESQSRELKQIQQEKVELEQHIQSLVREKQSLSQQLAECLRPEQVKELEARHKEDQELLLRKIKWYTENQELLDKNTTKLRAKDEEIHKLRMKLEEHKSETHMKLEENKIRAKEKAADLKKIQDFERQVKEMEHVISRRHPNSLPALMLAAASVPDHSADDNQVKGRTVQVLEVRVKKLEKELEAKDELAQQDLRAVEQKYNLVKLQFEERIADLEHQLSLYEQYRGDGAGSKEHPHSHAVALERELSSVRDRSKKQVTDMQAEVDRLSAELNKVRKNQENMMKNESKEAEVGLRQQIKTLQNELKDRQHDIEILHQTVDKLRSKSGKKDNLSKSIVAGSENFQKTPSHSKNYEPKAFADSELSALLFENQQLKTKVDQLKLEIDQQRVDLRRSLAETESGARHNQEKLEHQIEVLRVSHQKEVQRLLAEHTLNSSSSRLAQLQSQCDTQEVMIHHLQAQLKKVSSEADKMPKLKLQESQLLKQIDKLQEQLKEAKMVHAPEMRHFQSLEGKLMDLVQRQHKRETELDLFVRQSQDLCKTDLEEEIEKWKRMVEYKNQQLQVFRTELDSILEVLRTLQRQGVTLPVTAVFR